MAARNSKNRKNTATEEAAPVVSVNLEQGFQDKLVPDLGEQYKQIADYLTSHLMKYINEQMPMLIKQALVESDVKLKALAEENKKLTDAVSTHETKISDLSKEIGLLKEKVNKQNLISERLFHESNRNLAVVSGKGIPEGDASEDTKSMIINTFKQKLKVQVNPDKISVAHRLGVLKPNQKDHRPIKMKIDEATKEDLISACIKMKVNIFINDCLSPDLRDLFKRVLTIKKEHPNLILKAFTRNGVICIKKTEEGRLVKIRTDSELDTYLSPYFK